MGLSEALALLSALAQLANSPEGRRLLAKILDRSGMTLQELVAVGKAIDSIPLPEPGSGDK